MNSKQFLKEGFLEDAQEAHSDHEVQMARVDCYYAAEHAIVLHKLLRNISEEQGLEGWVASKITLANDYLKSVREHLEYQMMNVDAGEDDFLPLAEGLKPVKKNSVVESTAPVAEDEEEKFQDFERGPWYVIVKGKAVTVNGVPKKFNWLNGAKTYFRSMMDKNPEMAQKIKREYDEASDKKSVIYYTKNLPADNTTSTEQPVSEGEKPGLWTNIRAKRERIKGGSGERMRKPGSKGAPSDKDLKSIRAASESVVKEGDLHSDFGDIVQKVKGEWEAKRAKERQGMGPKYAPEQSKEELESRLRELESEFDPAYQYSDDYSFWTKQNAIAREIASIKKKLGSQGVAEDLADDLAKYARWQAAVGGAVGIGIGAANYADDQRPKVDIGGQQAYYVENPDWGKVPYNAMTLTDKDGKEYKVWTVKGGGGKVWYATPTEKVKEGVAEARIDEFYDEKSDKPEGGKLDRLVRRSLANKIPVFVLFDNKTSKSGYVQSEHPVKGFLVIGSGRKTYTTFNDETQKATKDGNRVYIQPRSMWNASREIDLDEGVAEGIPDVDHMHGPRDINLSWADTRDLLQKPFEHYGNYKEWYRDVNRVNSELLDDNAEFSTMSGGKIISINGKDFAFWSNRNGNGSIDIGIAKKHSGQGVAEGSSKQFEIIYLDQSGNRKRKIVSGTSKEAVVRQFKKQYKLEIEQVKQLQQGVAEGAKSQRDSIEMIDNIVALAKQHPDLFTIKSNYDSDIEIYRRGRDGHLVLNPRVDHETLIKVYNHLQNMINQSGQQGVAEGFKNTYSVGDRVDGPLGTGTIVAVSKNVNVDGRVKVKLDDPSKAGEDGKYKDSFVLTTTQLKHISEQGVAEGSDNSVEALIQMYNNRDQKIVKTKVFRSEDEANRWADRNNATILKLKDVAKKSTIDETTAGSIAGVVNPKIKNKSKVGTLFGGTYRQQKDK